MIALRRGKFRAFLPKPTSPASDVERYYEHSFVSSQDGETCVEIAVGPKGQSVEFTLKHVFKSVRIRIEGSKIEHAKQVAVYYQFP